VGWECGFEESGETAGRNLTDSYFKFNQAAVIVCKNIAFYNQSEVHIMLLDWYLEYLAYVFAIDVKLLYRRRTSGKPHVMDMRYCSTWMNVTDHEILEVNGEHVWPI
jgi:hypothetical protein